MAWIVRLIVWYGAFVTIFVTIGALRGIAVRHREAAGVRDAAIREAFALDRGIGIFARLRGLLVEIICQGIVWFMQGLHGLGLLRPPRGDTTRPPVVLLPGWTEDSGAMWCTARGLARRGLNPVLLDYRPGSMAAIERNAAFLAERLREIRAAHGGQPVVIVAHSMGGLVARTVLREQPDHGIAALVAIASPFYGTPTADTGRLLGGEAVHQMRRRSPFLVLHDPSHGSPVPTLCIVAQQEQIVMPEWTATVAGADLWVIPHPYGHTAPLMLPEVLDRIAAFAKAH